MAKTTQNISWLSAASRKYFKGGDGAYVSKSLEEFQKQLYFASGSLMDPNTLAKVLGRAGKPDLQPAEVMETKS
jgi:hypothetical protein